MSTSVTEVDGGKTIEVHLTGKLSGADYEHFVPLTEHRIEQYGKIRLLVVFSDFHGWDAEALWDDIKFDVKHFNDIERLAVVGDSRWEKGMSVFCRPFTTAKIKYFDTSHLADARAWVNEN
ncbi:STAS/SEC14 domain-containing protein [Rhodopirellula sp. MGV]|uniref:STAS/SEC14 domain-containing protein n=1 Tax=Rhodopirellula sp. MGV TaxID=2023130 RepID=UPI000B972614|nr:STAS/SEC14 domain-containing protein [Rhodopirellula sp. MGV]OYP33050.1 STAS/SEC14 domain-containing protein [Rhodopirellula sp. MGV]PNY35576.1 STAS/SEC14 domain-containing protein [Rhodopirellula baltica]